MLEDTKAANSGAAQPCSFDNSTCTKSSPWNGCALFSMRPYICTPQRVQAWRWIVAEESMTFRNWAPEVTLRLSRPTTATTENIAPFGFQHLVQPQAWLCDTFPVICTVTGACAH